MKLFGSTTSPFARRIRLLLEGKDYEFINLDIFSSEGQKTLTKENPAKKIPFIEDEGITVFDSRVVFRYLSQKHNMAALTWHQENQLTLIDAANDSLVSLLLSQRSGFDINDDKLFFKLQQERVHTVLQSLNKMVENGEFEQWHYPSICLFCLLDWAIFRELIVAEQYPALLKFQVQHTSRPIVEVTNPRQ